MTAAERERADVQRLLVFPVVIIVAVLALTVEALPYSRFAQPQCPQVGVKRTLRHDPLNGC